MKGCNLFLSTLIIATILVGIYAVHMYMAAMTPVWSSTAMQQAQIDLQASMVNTRTDVQAHTERSQLITGAMSGFGSVLLLLLACGGGVYVWRVYDQRRESWARAVDGTFALQPFNQADQTWLIDPNKSVFGVVGMDKRTGQITTDASMIGTDRQLAYATAVQTTRTAAAVTGGDGFRYAATGKYLAGAYDRPRQLDYQMEDEPPRLSAWYPLTLCDAFAQAMPDRWLLGQNDTGACEFNLSDNIHSGLLGATGTGKSSGTALLMALYAIKHGLHVIALDGKGGVDWAAYNKHLEAWPTDYTVMGDQLAQIVKIHNLRMKEIQRAGVANLVELDYQVKPLFVILEEFGFTMQALKAASKRTHDLVESELSNLMRVSRSTGIHFLLIDQSAQHWPGVIKANVKAWFAYRLGGQQGNAFNAYNLHELKPKGQFWHADNVYDAWFTKGESEPLLKKLPQRKISLLTDDTSIVLGREGTSQKDTPGHNTSAGATPVGNTSHDTSNPNDTSIKNPLLMGKPVSSKDKSTVRNVHSMTGSINETCRLVWGAKTPSRAQWVKEVLAGSEVHQ